MDFVNDINIFEQTLRKNYTSQNPDVVYIFVLIFYNFQK